MTWSIEREQELKKLWAEGLSASQCARVLGGGLSRNAVIGKVFRMNLPKRRPRQVTPRSNAWTDERREAMRAKMLARKKVAERKASADKHVNPTVARIKAPPPEVFKPAAEDLAAGAWNPLPNSAPIGIMDLSDKVCRWPVSDGAPFLFCGCAVADGSSYCPTHKHIGTGKGTTGERNAVKAAKSAAKQDRHIRKWLEAA